MLIAVAPAQPRALAEVLVNLDVELLAVRRRQHHLAEIVRPHSRIARRVRLGIQIQNGLPYFVPFGLRNHVALICRPVAVRVRLERIEDLVQHQVAVRVVGHRLRIIAVAFQIGGHRRHNVHRLPVAHDRQIPEEKCLVPADRSPRREPVLILLVVRHRSGVEEVPRVECGALPIPPPAAMDFVGPGLHHRIHNGAAVIPVFRGKTVVLYFEFLQSLHRGLIVHIRCAALALLRRAQQIPIQPDVRRRIPLPVRNKIGPAGIRILRARSRRLRHSASQKRQAKRVSIDQRNLHQILAAHIGAQRRVL